MPIRYFQLLNSDITDGSTTNSYYNIKIPPVLILRKLQDINLTISIKLSLMDLPVQFNNHYVKNGRVYITVPNEFEIQLSTIDMNSPFFFVDLNLFIYMNDTSLPLNKLKMEKLINEILYKNKDRNPFFLLYQFLHKYVLTIKLYLVHLELLALENTGKFSGGDMIHIYDSKKSIVTGRYWVRGKLGNRGKFTIGVDKASEKLILRWDNYFLADRASGPTGNANANVNVNAGANSLGSGLASASQLQRPMSDKAFNLTMSNNPSLLNIPAASSNPLIGSAINNVPGGITPSGAPGMSTPALAVTASERAGAILNENRFKRMPFIYHNILGNLESILDEIMYNHATVIRSELLATGIFREDEESPDVLYFRISTTSLSSAPIYLKIDLISGVFYFKNPTPLLLGYTQKINRTEKMEDLIKIFHRLKLDRITQVLRNMFEKTGWICSKAIKLPNLIPTNIQLPSAAGNIPATNTSGNSGVFGNGDLLQQDLFVYLPKWPVNWYLILSIISSNSSCIIEKRIGKIVSIKGQWTVKCLDASSYVSSKLESMTYRKVMSLQKTTIHRIVNHMLIDSLNQLKIRNRICPAEVISTQLPRYLASDLLGITDEGDLKERPPLHLNKDSKNRSLDEDEFTSIIALELGSFLEGYPALSNILDSSMFLKIDYLTSEIRLYAKFKRDSMIRQVKCDELLIRFVHGDSLAFYLTEAFEDLAHIVEYITTFRKKLMQLLVVTDVVERLHKNFASEYFRIIALKPNEVSFNYLNHSNDGEPQNTDHTPNIIPNNTTNFNNNNDNNNHNNQDCTINILTSEHTIKNLTVKLSESNPQRIIQPFINNGNYDYHFILNYLRVTSPLFNALRKIIGEGQSRGGSQTQTQAHNTSVTFGLHNLSEYQLVYYNIELGAKITLLIELKTVSHNNKEHVQFYVHFSKDKHITTKSPGYSLVHQVRSQIFAPELKYRMEGSSSPGASHSDSNEKSTVTATAATPEADRKMKFPHSIRLIDGIACPSSDIQAVLFEIHGILSGGGGGKAGDTGVTLPKNSP